MKVDKDKVIKQKPRMVKENFEDVKSKKKGMGMKEFYLKSYWVLTFFAHVLFLVIIFRSDISEFRGDPIMVLCLTFAILFILFSWVSINSTIPIFKTNDKIDFAWKRLKEMEADCKRREEAINILAGKKLGVSEKEIEEEIKKIK